MSCMCWESLTVFNCPKEKAKEIVSVIEEDPVFSDAFDYGTPIWEHDNLFLGSWEATNWGVDEYGAFGEFTKKFPEYVFMIDGENENGEHYRTYYKNGNSRSYEPTLVWPEFNPEDLE